MRNKNNSHSQNETIEKCIMIVDDNHDFAESLFDILELHGYVVETAYSEKDACKKIKDFDAHLALIDIRLGHSNGISLISEFKSVNPKILCVMMTAYADIDTSIQALKESAYDYLRKPIETPDLLATIDRCFERIRLEAEKSAAIKALKKSEKRYRAIVEGQTEFIVRYLPDGRLTFVNEAYFRYLGKTREKLIGSSFLNTFVEDDRKLIQHKFESLTIENPAAIDEYRAILQEGTIAWQQWFIKAIFDNNGNLIELQSVGRDITERKQAEKKIIESEQRYRSLIDDVLDNTKDGMFILNT
jgi:PAS domain S-box-containing protein